MKRLTLPIVNFDKYCEVYVDERDRRKRHSPLLPWQVRALICGKSGIGKSNAMLSLIFSPNGLAFENIYLYSKTLFQPKYQLLNDVLSQLPEIGYFPFEKHEEVIPVEDCRERSLCIFDDVSWEEQTNMKKYFAIGRHKHVDVFYLCQSYAQLPKHLLRDNANFLVCFKMDRTNLKHIWEDFISTDLPFPKFQEVCSTVWNKHPHGFLVIDLERPLNDGRFKEQFDKPITLPN